MYTYCVAIIAFSISSSSSSFSGSVTAGRYLSILIFNSSGDGELAIWTLKNYNILDMYKCFKIPLVTYFDKTNNFPHVIGIAFKYLMKNVPSFLGFTKLISEIRVLKFSSKWFTSILS